MSCSEESGDTGEDTAMIIYMLITATMGTMIITIMAEEKTKNN